MARKSGFVRRHGVMRRETLWLSGSSVNTTMGSAQAVLVTSLSAGALALRPFTVVRTRGIIYVRGDNPAAAENWDFAFGICIVTDQASAVGITAVPTPTTDDGSDSWFTYERAAGTTRAGELGDTGHFIQVDSKAMRKVEDGFDLVDVVENPLATGVVCQTYNRTLIKLH